METNVSGYKKCIDDLVEKEKLKTRNFKILQANLLKKPVDSKKLIKLRAQCVKEECSKVCDVNCQIHKLPVNNKENVIHKFDKVIFTKKDSKVNENNGKEIDSKLVYLGESSHNGEQVHENKNEETDSNKNNSLDNTDIHTKMKFSKKTSKHVGNNLVPVSKSRNGFTESKKIQEKLKDVNQHLVSQKNVSFRQDNTRTEVIEANCSRINDVDHQCICKIGQFFKNFADGKDSFTDLTMKFQRNNCIFKANKLRTKTLEPKSSLISIYEQLTDDIKNFVNTAIVERKIFTIVGKFTPLRNALIERRWIEKSETYLKQNMRDFGEKFGQLNNLSYSELHNKISNPNFIEKYRQALITTLLSNQQPDFYWVISGNPFPVISDEQKQTIINRYPAVFKKPYGSKQALADILNKNSHWVYNEDESDILYPRTYNLACSCEKKEFIKDYHITAAISLLNYATSSPHKTSNFYSVPNEMFNFAFSQCINYMNTKQHKDIDETIPEAKDSEWTSYLKFFYDMFHNFDYLDRNYLFTKEQVNVSKHVIREIMKYFPNLKAEGYLNLWIVKPHHGTQGTGIIVCRTLEDIFSILQNKESNKYVVQKYIERPLLIHGIKFDIRQWFVIAHQPNLHVWMYRDFYLRFSTQIFNLDNLHSAIHLTNNAIQRKYNPYDRHSSIPSHNMWQSDKFEAYLKERGCVQEWHNINKKMEQCVVGVIKCCQENMSARVNSFEILGMDFMITDDFQPYLLEINSRPALYASTTVTAKLSREVLADIIKVTVDYPQNPNASTGKFDLIYKEEINQKCCGSKEEDLSVVGKKYFHKI